MRLIQEKDHWIILDKGLPIKYWLLKAADLEAGCKDQAINLSNLPFAFHHIALMPDCHQGYGVPIGGILATKGVIIPNAVGVDIGCSVSVRKTNLHKDELGVEDLKKIMNKLRDRIPVGMNHNKEKVDISWMPQIGKDLSSEIFGTNGISEEEFLSSNIILKEYEDARYQLGTIGGGNHYLSIDYDSKGFIWINIHTGSRNLGYKVGGYYNKLARQLNQRWYSSIPDNWELAFLPEGSIEYNMYLAEMKYCVEFARCNHNLLLNKTSQALSERFPHIEFDEPLTITHNYAAMEHHFGENVMIHRKGAVRARKEEMVIIPGSIGTGTYIARGKGNVDSFQSCSHGAGRAMGRNAAISSLDLDKEIKILEDQGIVHGIRNKKDLEEATGSYKDLNSVMNNQNYLVEEVEKLNTYGNIKG